MSSKVQSLHYFGPEGIRGVANNGTLTAELALRVGQAAGVYFKQGEHRHRALVGKDTRLSGYMLETALVAGLTSAGMDVLLTGPIPVPGVAFLTCSMRADLGIMISASEASYETNGIRLFGPRGTKLPARQEQEIERLIASGVGKRLAKSPDLGRAKRIDVAQDRYIECVKGLLGRKEQFDGIRVVLDCANGAAYKVAPQAMQELGAEVIAVNVEPNGFNINNECGIAAAHALGCKVRKYRADVGFAFDGDADQMVVSDEKGATFDAARVRASFAKESWCDDGLAIALKLVELMRAKRESASVICQRFKK